jgi:hypothetical protein
MKKLVLAIISMVMLFSCASGRYINLTDPQAMFDAGEILYRQHPELANYYDQGVLQITSLREVNVGDGVDYRIKYRFVKHHIYDYSDRMMILKDKFPELYEMYVSGLIEITSLYRYVNDYVEIKYHVSYRRIYDFYYDYHPYLYPYGGYRYYYRSRPLPPPSPRVEPAPRPNDNRPPQARPNDPPRQQPNTNPSNPPRRQPNTTPQVRPSNPPANRGSQPTRPSTPPSNSGGARRGR